MRTNSYSAYWQTYTYVLEKMLFLLYNFVVLVKDVTVFNMKCSRSTIAVVCSTNNGLF